MIWGGISLLSLGRKQAQKFVYDHTAREWQSWDTNPVLHSRIYAVAQHTKLSKFR